jgi:ribosomal-protein-alanine N-acetyltransferase
MLQAPKIPTIRTERLIIRPWQRSDADEMFEYASDLEVTRSAMWLPHTSVDESIRDISDAIARYEKDSWMYLGIEHIADRKFIGSVGFVAWNRTDRRAELAFALHRKYWNRGIMTEACRAVLQFGWDEMQLHRIEAKCIATNGPSIAILHKLGFVREGLRKEAARIDQSYTDVIEWGLLRS